MSTLEDSTGTFIGARVGPDFRLRTRTIQQSEMDDAAGRGDSYLVSTGEITLTSGDESALLYFKNNETNDIFISSVSLSLTPSDGSALDAFRLRFYKNVTSGTIISTATDVDIISNNNFGSTNTLTVDAFKGFETATVVGGALDTFGFAPNGLGGFSPASLILPKGTSLTVTVAPPSGNTSTDVSIGIEVRLLDLDTV